MIRDELAPSILELGEISIPGGDPSGIDRIREFNIRYTEIVKRIARVVVDCKSIPILSRTE